MAEIMHWFKYYNESPFGYYRSDMREALNCAVFAAPHSKTSFPLSSFMLDAPEKEKPTAEELAEKTIGIFGGMAHG